MDNRTGAISDFTSRGGVNNGFLIFPNGIEPISRSELWNHVEAAERRINSTVAREFEVSLPVELPLETSILIARDFTCWLVDRYGFVADTNIHVPTRKAKRKRRRDGADGKSVLGREDELHDKNVHAHILTSTRVMTVNGFDAKCRILDAAKTGSVEIELIRAQWARRVNEALEGHDVTDHLDHRSYERQGLLVIPTEHEGRGVGANERRARNDDLRKKNLLILQIAEELAVARSALEVRLMRDAMAADGVALSSPKSVPMSAILQREQFKRIAQRFRVSAEEVAADPELWWRLLQGDQGDDLDGFVRCDSVGGQGPSLGTRWRAAAVVGGRTLHIRMPEEMLGFIERGNSLRVCPSVSLDPEVVVAALLVAASKSTGFKVTGCAQFRILAIEKASELGILELIKDLTEAELAAVVDMSMKAAFDPGRPGRH